MTPYTALVTGAAGHMGTALCHALRAAGHEVRALVRSDARALTALAQQPGPGRLTLHPGDILSPGTLGGACNGAAFVFHAAAQITLGRGQDPRAAAINIAGTRNVAAACQQAGARLIHVSSIQALEQRPLDAPLTEERPLVSSTDATALTYDRHKAEAERAVLAAVAGGLDAVIINPASLLGPYDHKPSYMGRVLRLLHQGLLPAVVAGGQSWVDVRDVAQGALAAAERGRRGERYLLAGTFLSIAELLALYEEVSGARAPRLQSPLWLAQACAPLFERGARALGQEPLFSSGALQALRGNPDIRSDKAQRELGYALRPLHDTLADSYRFLRETGQIPATRPTLTARARALWPRPPAAKNEARP